MTKNHASKANKKHASRGHASTLDRSSKSAHATAQGPRTWTPQERLSAIVATGSMDEAQRNAWCQANGVPVQELQDWRASVTQALGKADEPSALARDKSERQRIKELERQIQRKEKALAEAEALLVLRTKLAQIFPPDKGGRD